jgi:hypothetical protein
MLQRLAAAFTRGDLIPYLGPGALAGVVDNATGESIPAIWLLPRTDATGSRS